MPSRLVVVGGGAAGMSAASAARRVDPASGDRRAGGDRLRRLRALRAALLPLRAGRARRGPGRLPAGVLPRPAPARPAPARQGRRAGHGAPHASSTSQDGHANRIGFGRARGDHRRRAEHVPAAPGCRRTGCSPSGRWRTPIALRTLLDAGRVGRALVVGAGYIGLEMAEAFAARGCAVTVVERLDRVLPNLDVEVAALVEKHVREHVDLKLGTDVAAALAEPDAAPDVVVLSTGVRPAASIAAVAGAETGPGGALLVDDAMRTSLPDVWAAGRLHRAAPPRARRAGVRAARAGRQQDRAGRGHGRRRRRRDVRRRGRHRRRQGVRLRGGPHRAHPGRGDRGRPRRVGHRRRRPVAGRSTTPGSRRCTSGWCTNAAAGCSAPSWSGGRVRRSGSTWWPPRCTPGSRWPTCAAFDLSYAPPYSPVYDPLTFAAQAALRKLAGDQHDHTGRGGDRRCLRHRPRDLRPAARRRVSPWPCSTWTATPRRSPPGRTGWASRPTSPQEPTCERAFAAVVRRVRPGRRAGQQRRHQRRAGRHAAAHHVRRGLGPGARR